MQTIENIKIMQESHMTVAPWLMHTPEINLTLTNTQKSTTETKIKYHEILISYQNHIKIFTDGSKINQSSTAAAIIQYKIPHTISQHLPNYTSIFTAELIAINMALMHIAGSQNNKHIIITDSLSNILALKQYKPKNPLIIQTQVKIDDLIRNNNEITLLWVPSHIGILSPTSRSRKLT